MLHFLIHIFNFIKQTTYLGLVISYKTGQFIIYGLNILIDLLVQINKNVGTLLRVLFEDFYIFLCDVGQRVLHILITISDIFQKFVACITQLCEIIKFSVLAVLFTITEMYNAVFGTIAKVVSGFGQILVTIKHLILLLGSGIWFAITLIPLFIVYVCTMFTYYIGCFIDEIIKIISSSVTNTKLFINTSYEFLTDVPLESVAGLIAGGCILYVIIKFHILLYHKLLSACELIRQNAQRIRLRITTRRQEPVANVSSESEQTDPSSDESDQESVDGDCSENQMCIICHERIKCILMLPCRHVCVCNICNVRLRNYNRTCPICRSVVQNTMKVFV